jgi:hypothetical protein
MDKDLEYLVGRVCSRTCGTVVSGGSWAGTSKSYRVWGLRKSRLRAVCRPMVGAGAARCLFLAPASYHELHGLVIYADLLKSFVIVKIAAAHHLEAVTDK